MLATGFFQVDCAVTLQRLGCLFVIEISSRYARVPGVTANPVGSRELLDEAAEGSPALDPLLGEVSDRVVGPRRPELPAAMGAPPVVVGRVVGQDQPSV
jgi:hypothetical protein